ncbi:MAG TPA: mobile mystery protein B [Planctomicrobium sp.]|nr:mobile mystery protein B [Planctomicrobium sp.]
MKWAPLPGETPLDDVSGLILKNIRTRKQLFLAEAENIRKATVKYLAQTPTARMAPFDLSWCLKLHHEMFGEIWNWAGRPRQQNLNIGVPWLQVESSLRQTLDDLKYWESNWSDVVEQATHLHHRVVQIHPFLNGNGRWARMLANIWLSRHESPLVLWPEETIGSISVIRDEYLQAIRSADQGNFALLIAMHQKYLEQ